MRRFFLECCSVRTLPERVISLAPVSNYTHRFLYYGHCRRCNKLIAHLSEYDWLNDKTIIDRNKPKRIKHIDTWLASLEKQGTDNPIIPKIAHGNKSAMAFIFGKSKETPLGVLHQGIDFNGTKRKEFLIAK